MACRTLYYSRTQYVLVKKKTRGFAVGFPPRPSGFSCFYTLPVPCRRVGLFSRTAIRALVNAVRLKTTENTLKARGRRKQGENHRIRIAAVRTRFPGDIRNISPIESRKYVWGHNRRWRRTPPLISPRTAAPGGYNFCVSYRVAKFRHDENEKIPPGDHRNVQSSNRFMEYYRRKSTR